MQSTSEVRSGSSRTHILIAAAAVVALLAACQDGSGGSGLEPTAFDSKPLALAAHPDEPTGYFEVCKTGGAGVTGTFSFTLGGPNVVAQTVSVPVGQCTGPIQANVGAVTVTEVATAGFAADKITVSPEGGSTTSLETHAATMVVTHGDVSAGHVVTFHNVTTGEARTGTLKVCKIAGTGLTAGTSYTFAVTRAGAAAATLQVSAGAAAQGGNCALLGGVRSPTKLAAGTQVTVTETAVPNVHVSAMTVTPSDRGTMDVAARSAVVTIGGGETVVTFTNTAGEAPPPVGPAGGVSLEICKYGVGSALGRTFSFTTSATGAMVTSLVAGEGPPGHCATLALAIAPGANVTVTEAAAAGFALASTNLSGVGTTDLAARTVRLTTASGMNRVAFTNVPATEVGRVCTHSQGFFKNHEEAVAELLTLGRSRNSALVSSADALTLRVGDQTLTAAQIDELLGTPPRGDARIILMHQLIAAELNAMMFGSTPLPTGVSAAITAANTILGGGVTAAERSDALALAEQLDKFNNSNECHDD